MLNYIVSFSLITPLLCSLHCFLFVGSNKTSMLSSNLQSATELEILQLPVCIIERPLLAAVYLVMKAAWCNTKQQCFTVLFYKLL